MKDVDDPGHEFLIRAITAGLYAAGSMVASQSVQAMGRIPEKLVSGKSIYALTGDVKVNGKAATENTFIDVNSTVTTGDSSHVIFVVGMDDFVLRSNAHLKLKVMLFCRKLNYSVESCSRCLAGEVKSRNCPAYDNGNHRCSGNGGVPGV